MGLIKLQSYQTVSEKKLIESFNSMLVSADENFTYTLQQLSSPIPAFIGKPANNVLGVKYNGSTPFLDYVDVDSIVNLQNIWNGYLNVNNSLSLTRPMEFLLRAGAAPFADFKITGRSTFGSGAIKHQVAVTQTSSDGDLNELHNVNNLSLTGNSVSINANFGQVNLNTLKVGDYTFPTKSGVSGQVLRVGLSKTLEFGFLDPHLISNSGSYTLNELKPLVLKGSNNAAALGFNGTTDGLYASPEISIAPYITLKFGGADIFSATQPVALQGAPASSPVLEFKAPIVLPSIDSFDTTKAHIGSLWYDGATKTLILVGPDGNVVIGAAEGSTSINTVESKEFILNPTSSLVMGGGTPEAPSLKIGDSGISSTSRDLKVTVSDKAVAKFTERGIESPTESLGSAKIVLDGSVGINNPSTPVYTFSGADKLGIYRSNINSIAVAVKGNPVIEFKESEIDAKSKKVTNLANPTNSKDAATKEYVDSIAPQMPNGTIPIAGGHGTKYAQSNMKLINGVLELSPIKSTPAISLKTINGGSVTIRTPPVTQNVTFSLPTNQVANGLLQLDSTGNTSWVNRDSLIQGFMKSDGSVSMTSGIKVNANTNKDNLIISSGNLGFYASNSVNPKIGMAAEGSKLLEIDVQGKTLTGIGSSLNAPLIRLDSTLNSYVALAESETYSASPTYSFAGEPATGIGQAYVQAVSMIVAGTPRLTASTNGIVAHGSRIQNIATPLSDHDAATKEYVDKAVKEPIQMSFLITALPPLWTTGNTVVMSIYDKALIYQNAMIPLTYEGNADTDKVIIPKDFNTNPKCQVYIEGRLVPKMPIASGYRPVSYLNSRALLLNHHISVGYVITIMLD